MKRVVVILYAFNELAPDVQEELLCHDARELGVDPEVLRQRYNALGEVFTADGIILTRTYEPAGRSVAEIEEMISRSRRIIALMQQEYDAENSGIRPDVGRLQWMREIGDMARVRERALQWAAGLRDNM